MQATPRMVSYGYPSCVSCHFAPQGRGLLNSYGRGIDVAQSYSKKDFTALLFGKPADPDKPEGNWDGRFGSVLADFIVSLRLNQQIEGDKRDPGIAALYRQIVFLGQEDRLRVNTEVGYLDGGLAETSLGPNLTATDGDVVFLKKLLLEWRFGVGENKGQEIAIGRDYLPLGLQIDDHAAYILHLNRAGTYDYPLQVKYFVWDEKSLASVYLHGPSFEEPDHRREYGGGFLYERYLSNKLALGLQGLAGFSDESDRVRVGPYLRWGISEKWALLAEVDYAKFFDGRFSQPEGDQVTTFVQLFYHHYEWLVSSVTGNYAYSDFLRGKEHLASFRYTASARLNRSLTVGLTYSIGDTRRNLSDAQEFGAFASFKF